MPEGRLLMYVNIKEILRTKLKKRNNIQYNLIQIYLFQNIDKIINIILLPLNE